MNYSTLKPVTSAFAAIAVLTLALGFASCTKKTEAPATTAATTPGAAPALPDLKIEELKVGTGAEAVAGKVIKAHYTGWLTDGKKFDSSVDRGTPIEFPLGAGRVIPGWDKGIVGMKVGGKRKLTIPPNLGYGPNGAPPVIPPNSTLIFEVELVGVN